MYNTIKLYLWSDSCFSQGQTYSALLELEHEQFSILELDEVHKYVTEVEYLHPSPPICSA